MAKRICALCKASDKDARAIEGRGLKMRSRFDGSEFICADNCQFAERAGIDGMGIKERRRVKEIADRMRRTIPIVNTLSEGEVAGASVNDNAFWGNTCQKCGQADIPLMGIGQDRQCVDIFACLIADNPHRQGQLI